MLAITLLHAQSVNFDWAKQMGGTLAGYGSSIAVDGLGNVYTLGSFIGTVDFDPGTGVFNLTAVGVEDIFISKLNAAGNFVWAKQIAGTINGHAVGNSLTVDAEGNVYTTGSVYGTSVDFDPGAGVFDMGAASGGEDMFVSKLDACGNFVWAKQIGGAINDHAIGKSIVIDGSGNIYITGVFYGSAVDFDPGPGVYILNSSYNVGKIFVAKLDPTGKFVWAQQMIAIFDGIAIFGGYGNSIAVDGSGNVYTTGYYGGTVDFDPGPGVFKLSTVYGDNFISKLDASGNFIWAKQMGQTSNSFASGNSIAVDTSGNVYTSGHFTGTVDFDPGPALFNISAISRTNGFISKLNAAGDFVWAKKMVEIIYGAGILGPGNKSLAVDVSGNIYTTGAFEGTEDFDPGVAVSNMTAAGKEDVFVSKLDGSGNFVWAKKMGGSGSGQGSSITLDATGNVYTTGTFGGTLDFDPGSGVYNLNSIGSYDIFVHKMSHCTNSTSSTITALACGSHTLNCVIYTSSGVYTQILLNKAGCDSIITLNLTINNTNSTVNVNAEACDSYSWNGQTLTTSGTYTDTLIAAAGCDSIVTLQLAIKAKSFSAIDETICQGQDYAGYTTGGTYVDTLVAANGCDSIRTIQLTVLPRPDPDLGGAKNLCPGDSLILYPGQFNSYLWQDGTTRDRNIIKLPGFYSVEVTNNCGTARDEILIKEKICDIYFSSAFTPNNDGINDLFKILGGDNIKDYRLVIYNRWGQKMFETFDYAKGWDGSFKGKLQPTALYVWYCEFNQPGKASQTKMKGIVTLIR